MRATDIIWKNFIHYDKMHKYFLLKNDEMNKTDIRMNKIKIFFGYRGSDRLKTRNRSFGFWMCHLRKAE